MFHFFKPILQILTCAAVVFSHATVNAQDSNHGNKKLVVASFGGQLDNVYRNIFKEFEQRYHVAIQWVPGTAPANVAKVTATRNTPEYDLLLTDDINQRLASKAGLLEKIDTHVLSQWNGLPQYAKAKGDDGVAIGAFVTGLYYRSDEFKKRGWAAPTSWNDLFKSEYCGHIGLERASQVYTLNAVIMLADANINQIDRGISRFAELSKCSTVLEPAAAKHEEKIQLGEYLLGVNSSIRALPIALKLHDLKFVLPKEGAVVSSTMVSPVKGAPNAVLAQEFIQWFLSVDAQKVLMTELFYSPVNNEVKIPDALAKAGIPDRETLLKQPKIDGEAVVEQRRVWAQKLERAISK